MTLPRIEHPREPLGGKLAPLKREAVLRTHSSTPESVRPCVLDGSIECISPYVHTADMTHGVCVIGKGQHVSPTATLLCRPFIEIRRKYAPNTIFLANPFSWPHTQLWISCC